MKTILVLLSLCGLGWAAVYFYGGYASFDPTEQGREALAKLSPGMTFAQVCDAAGEPKKFQVMVLESERIGGEVYEHIVPGPESRTTRENIGARILAGNMPHGFQTTYFFSHQVAFTVVYDLQGTVIDIFDAPTAADLFQTRQP